MQCVIIHSLESTTRVPALSQAWAVPLGSLGVCPCCDPTVRLSQSTVGGPSSGSGSVFTPTVCLCLYLGQTLADSFLLHWSTITEACTGSGETLHLSHLQGSTMVSTHTKHLTRFAYDFGVFGISLHGIPFQPLAFCGSLCEPAAD